jgi:predicted alpha/beta-hydrolase family hydrolase
MPEERIAVTVNQAHTVTAVRTPAGTASPAVRFVYAPGAGSGLADAFGVFAARELAKHGIETWRFQFPYKEKGRSAPDPPALLQSTWRAVLDVVAQAGDGPIVIGGRSMGGRIASMVVASGDATVAGLILLAYPLVPPGKASSDRADHFPKIGVPVLLCSGTRDNFATPDQLREAAALIPRATLHFLEGADHGFSTLKAAGRTKDDVYREAVEEILSFCNGLTGLAPAPTV